MISLCQRVSTLFTITNSYQTVYINQSINQFISICIIIYNAICIIIFIHWDTYRGCTKDNNICLVVQPIHNIITHLHMYLHLSTSQLNRHIVGGTNITKAQLSNQYRDKKESHTISFHRLLISINNICFYMIIKCSYCLTRLGHSRQVGPCYRCLVHTEF